MKVMFDTLIKVMIATMMRMTTTMMMMKVMVGSQGQ